MNVVIDLDGTLIDSDNDGNIYGRPYLDEFLNFCFDNFETVNIWTAANNRWCKKVLREKLHKWTFHKVYHRDKCIRTTGRSGFIKDLRKMYNGSITKKNTVIIDDTPEVCRLNMRNAIIVYSYNRHKDDHHLLDLMVRLEKQIIPAYSEHLDVRRLMLG